MGTGKVQDQRWPRAGKKPLLRDFLTFSLIYYIMGSAIRGCTGFDRRFWAINSESGFHLPR